jgi:hypothetical protein
MSSGSIRQGIRRKSLFPGFYQFFADSHPFKESRLLQVKGVDFHIDRRAPFEVKSARQ